MIQYRVKDVNEDSWSDSFVWNIPQPDLGDHSKCKDGTDNVTIPQFDGNFDSDTSSDDFKKASFKHKKKQSAKKNKKALKFTNSSKTLKEEQSQESSQTAPLTISIPVVAASKKTFTKVTNTKPVKRKASGQQSQSSKRKRGDSTFTVNNEHCLKFIDESIPVAISPYSRYRSRAAANRTDETVSCKCPAALNTKQNKMEYIKECYKLFKLRDLKVVLTDIRKTPDYSHYKHSYSNHGNRNQIAQTTPKKQEEKRRGRKPKLKIKFKKNEGTGRFYIKSSPQTPQSTTEGPTPEQATNRDCTLLRTAMKVEETSEEQVTHPSNEIDAEIEILDVSRLIVNNNDTFHDSLHKLSFESPMKYLSDQEHCDDLPECSALSPCYSDVSEEFAFPDVSLDEIPESPERQPVDPSDALPELSTYGTPTKVVSDEPATRRSILALKIGKALDFTPTQTIESNDSVISNNCLTSSQMLKETPVIPVETPSESCVQKELLCNTISQDEPTSEVVADGQYILNRETFCAEADVDDNENTDDKYLKRTLSYSLDYKEIDQASEDTAIDNENRTILPSETELETLCEVKNKLKENDVEIIQKTKDNDSRSSESALDTERKNPPICTFQIVFESNESSSNAGEASKSESFEQNKPAITESDEIISIETDLHQPEPDMLSPLMYDTGSFLFKTRKEGECDSEMGNDSVVSSNCDIKSGDLQLSSKSNSPVRDLSLRFVDSQEYQNVNKVQQPTSSQGSQLIVSPESVEYERDTRISSSNAQPDLLSPRFVHSQEYQVVNVFQRSEPRTDEKDHPDPIEKNTADEFTILKPQKKPPSFGAVLQTIYQFNINETSNQPAFYGDKNDDCALR